MIALALWATCNPDCHEVSSRFNALIVLSRGAWIILAANAAKQARQLQSIQQKHVQQDHSYARCDSEPKSAAKSMKTPGDQILQMGDVNGVIPVEMEVNTDWTIHPSSSKDSYSKVAQLEEKIKDVEKEKRVYMRKLLCCRNIDFWCALKTMIRKQDSGSRRQKPWATIPCPPAAWPSWTIRSQIKWAYLKLHSLTLLAHGLCFYLRNSLNCFHCQARYKMIAGCHPHYKSTPVLELY